MHENHRDLHYSDLSLADVGRVFWWRDRVFRGFPAAAAEAVRRLFDSGLIARLVAEGFLVESWISEEQFDEFALIVEHAPIPLTLYPREWSFSMTKDAADMVLRMNDIARSFGYQTKDCNGYNVLFDGGRPVYVDLGSFVPVESRDEVLFAYEEFQLSYTFPLHLWSSAGQHLGVMAAPRAAGRLLAPETYLRYRWLPLRVVGDMWLIRSFKIMSSLRTLRHNDFGKLRVRHSHAVVRALKVLQRSGWLEGPARISRLRARIARLRNRHGDATMWAAYHDSLSQAAGLTSTPRFDAVIDRLRDLGVRSLLEVAGNQGVLCRLAARAIPGLRATCTDADGVAIDKGYTAARAEGTKIDWAVVNPFADECSPVEIPSARRFEADAVVALAITHHLTLTQGIHLRYVFEVLSRFSRRYVFIEFMPLGLHDGRRAPPLPDWYHEKWFAEEFARHFVLVERVQLERNRILYVGARSGRP